MPRRRREDSLHTIHVHLDRNDPSLAARNTTAHATYETAFQDAYGLQIGGGGGHGHAQELDQSTPRESQMYAPSELGEWLSSARPEDSDLDYMLPATTYDPNTQHQMSARRSSPTLGLGPQPVLTRAQQVYMPEVDIYSAHDAPSPRAQAPYGDAPAMMAASGYPYGYHEQAEYGIVPDLNPVEARFAEMSLQVGDPDRNEEERRGRTPPRAPRRLRSRAVLSIYGREDIPASPAYQETYQDPYDPSMQTHQQRDHLGGQVASDGLYGDWSEIRRARQLPYHLRDDTTTALRLPPFFPERAAPQPEPRYLPGFVSREPQIEAEQRELRRKERARRRQENPELHDQRVRDRRYPPTAWQLRYEEANNTFTNRVRSRVESAWAETRSRSRSRSRSRNNSATTTKSDTRGHSRRQSKDRSRGLTVRTDTERAPRSLSTGRSLLSPALKACFSPFLRRKSSDESFTCTTAHDLEKKHRR